MRMARVSLVVVALLLGVSAAMPQTAGTVAGSYVLTLQPSSRCRGLAAAYRVGVRASSTPLGPRDEVHARAADGSDPELFAVEMLRTRDHVHGPIGTTDAAVITEEGASLVLHLMTDGDVTPGASGKGEARGTMFGDIVLVLRNGDEVPCRAPTFDHRWSLTSP